MFFDRMPNPRKRTKLAKGYTYWNQLHDDWSKEWFNSGYTTGTILSVYPLLGCVPFVVLGWIMLSISRNGRGDLINPDAAHYGMNFIVWPLLLAVINYIVVSSNYEVMDKD